MPEKPLTNKQIVDTMQG